MKTYYFQQYFENSSPNPKGRIVWNSATKGTYVRAIHGELKK